MKYRLSKTKNRLRVEVAQSNKKKPNDEVLKPINFWLKKKKKEIGTYDTTNNDFFFWYRKFL